MRSMLHAGWSAYKGKLPEGILPCFEQGRKIARIIHQTYPSRTVPREIRDCMEHTAAINPSWECRLYDDHHILDFIRDNYDPRVLEIYLRINPAYGVVRADLFRYLLMYKLGGVYMDIKSAMSRPLDSVLLPGDRYLLSYWRNGPGEEFEGWGVHQVPQAAARNAPFREFQQWYIVASPGHPFLRAVLERVMNNIIRYNLGLHGAGQYGVLRLTGPIAYTLAIQPLLDLHEHRFVDSMHELGFEYSIYRSSGSLDRHKSLFGNHYTFRNDSIITPSGTDRVLEHLLKKVSSITTRIRKCC